MDVVRIVGSVFGVVGLGLLAGAGLAVQSTQSFLADAVSAPGTVQGLVARTSTDSDGHRSTTYAPEVRFTTAEGRDITFVSATSSSPPDHQVGDAVEVLYRPQDPAGARIHDWFSLWGLPTILGGMGTVFTVVGGGLAVATLRGRRTATALAARGVGAGGPAEPDDLMPDDVTADEADDVDDVDEEQESATASNPGLREHGVRVHADVQHVRPTGTYAANGSENHRVVAQWLDPDRHEVRVFASEEVPFDPTPYLTGKTVDVYIDPHDASRHYVDLSFLPPAAH